MITLFHPKPEIMASKMVLCTPSFPFQQNPPSTHLLGGADFGRGARGTGGRRGGTAAAAGSGVCAGVPAVAGGVQGLSGGVELGRGGLKPRQNW